MHSGIWEVAWSTGSLRKNSKKHCCRRVNSRSIRGQYFRNFLMEQARAEHAPKASQMFFFIYRLVSAYTIH